MPPFPIVFILLLFILPFPGEHIIFPRLALSLGNRIWQSWLKGWSRLYCHNRRFFLTSPPHYLPELLRWPCAVPRAEVCLADWILSKAKTTPGYLSSVDFPNHRFLHFWQISDLFHFLAGSPGLLPAVYRRVVDDLLSLQEGVDQPGRNVQSMIQNLAETGAGEAPPSAGVPQRAFEEAMQVGEQRIARVADELRVAFESERKCGNGVEGSGDRV
jgi:hypothetical protein